MLGGGAVKISARDTVFPKVFLTSPGLGLKNKHSETLQIM